MTTGAQAQCERVLALLRERPRTTIDLHANYVLAAGCVVRRLRLRGHVIVTKTLPSRVAEYTLVSEAASA